MAGADHDDDNCLVMMTTLMIAALAAMGAPSSSSLVLVFDVRPDQSWLLASQRYSSCILQFGRGRGERQTMTTWKFASASLPADASRARS